MFKIDFIEHLNDEDSSLSYGNILIGDWNIFPGVVIVTITLTELHDFPLTDKNKFDWVGNGNGKIVKVEIKKHEVCFNSKQEKHSFRYV